MSSTPTKNQVSVNLHTTLPFGIGTAKFGLVEAVHAFAAIVLVVAAFAYTAPSRAITKWPKSFPFHKIRRFLDLGDLWI